MGRRVKREEEEGAVLTLPPPFAKRAGRRQLFAAGSCSKKMPFSAEICPVHLLFYISLFHFTPFKDMA